MTSRVHQISGYIERSHAELLRTRGRVLYRIVAVLVASLGVAGLFAQGQTTITLNVSRSVPLGFYIRSEQPIARTSLIRLPLPQALADFAAQTHKDLGYDTILKPVLGLPGDHICMTTEPATINGVELPPATKTAMTGEALPLWLECRTLDEDEFFVMSTHDHSFDSRNFGPIKRPMIIGVYQPLWTWK